MTITTASVHEPNLQECLTVMADTRALCLQLLSESTSPSTTTPTNHQHSQKLLAANLSRLRGLHRNMYIALRQTKYVTAEARQEQDRLHLQLQNLYYEQRHLRGEIDACLEFPHTYMTISLVPEDEFIHQHPEFTATDPHDLMKQRLYDERAQREELEIQRKELVVKKQRLIAENKKRKEDLESLDEQLKKFIESSKPIQRTFEKEY